ncbi:adenosylcobinamide amidohydrolase [Gordonia neofelifaecis]|nr:adenosylcobinamide amidohydrolase [Gordonia neofelifaecis]
MSMDLQFLRTLDGGAPLTTSVWRVGPGRRGVSSAMLGGGIGPIAWVINAQVPGGYSRMDPVAHLQEMANGCGLSGRGVGMLTAAAVDRTVTRVDGAVIASATVGLRVPTWAAAPAGNADPELAPMVLPGPPRPGTINVTVDLPVALTDAALINTVMTATEAKTQALLEAGYPATGTASDAVVVVCDEAGAPEPFAGPRSEWGGALARAVHAAVREGADDYTRRLRDGGL